MHEQRSAALLCSLKKQLATKELNGGLALEYLPLAGWIVTLLVKQPLNNRPHSLLGGKAAGQRVGEFPLCRRVGEKHEAPLVKPVVSKVGRLYSWPCRMATPFLVL